MPIYHRHWFARIYDNLPNDIAHFYAFGKTAASRIGAGLFLIDFGK